MNLLGIISIAVITVSGIFAGYRQFQMLQQNSYFIKRYAKWLKGNFKFRSVISTVLMLLSGVSVVFGLNTVLCIVAVLSLLRIKTAFSDNKKSIKKLVMTSRVKRTFITFVVICLIPYILGVTVNEYLFLISVVFAFAVFLPVILSVTVMSPVEKAFKRYYINDAKRILKSNENLKVIGITGSYGKTSTKYIVGRILSEKFNTLITPKSFNTPMGIVRAVRENMKPQTEVFVAEMGAKNIGDVKEICDIVNPEYGIITSVGPQHLDTFKSIDNVIKTKFELADECVKNNGTVFLNTDNEYIKNRTVNGNTVSYGTTADCSYRAENITYGRYGLSFTVAHKNERLELTTSLLGIHNALNITSAVAVAKELGVRNEDIKYAVSKLEPIEHRLQMKSYINSSILIDDAYNANPSGSVAAVEVLGSFSGMKKIIVTPGLVELGDKEYEYNKKLGAAAAKHCDVIILVGKKRSVPLKDGVLSKGFSEDNLYIAENFKDAVKIFSPMCDGNTVILFENDLPDNYAG